MSDVAVIAVSAAATVLTVAVVVWWVISKVTEGNRAVLVREQQDATILSLQAEISRKDALSVALKKRNEFLWTKAVSALGEDALLSLAGGDPGDLPGTGVRPSDRLLDPFEDSDDTDTGDLPETP